MFIVSYALLFAPVPCRASIRSYSLMYSYHFQVTSVLEAPYPLLALLWRMKSFKLRPLNALRPPRLQFFTNSCRFFLALFCAGFLPQLLPFMSPVRKFRFSSSCVPFNWPPAISLPLLTVFTVFLSMIFALLRSLLDICRLRTFLSVPACFLISFSTLVIFHVLVHGFVPPGTVWVEKPRRF